MYRPSGQPQAAGHPNGPSYREHGKTPLRRGCGSNENGDTAEDHGREDCSFHTYRHLGPSADQTPVISPSGKQRINLGADQLRRPVRPCIFLHAPIRSSWPAASCGPADCCDLLPQGPQSSLSPSVGRLGNRPPRLHSASHKSYRQPSSLWPLTGIIKPRHPVVRHPLIKIIHRRLRAGGRDGPIAV